ncbi:GP63-like [Trichomonas vaginalis G3]|uniref:GP63-like n=1 Tax=Trichomonas vaginalis (strain ATCC PRA-98 / G3) TaxID=412133 RepID=A2DQ24_TRIV3|nr:regulation of choline O-acetyltransferase protein [Trichomonas vaginalis G3]EAY17451.1 GP63-like [Trichomonas vaginalis G3]KAI5533557.1 regulation of choline O-acetyltransferase protein [Trichomonas vaginalis G3]|eukprot:XP_001329586.1 GP63-like [Trichomonas vaginalis G3]
MILFLISISIHNCTHDQFMKNIPRYSAKAYSKRSLKSPTWENIRITFDYRYMDKTIDDGKTCYSSSSCSSEDVLTDAKINVVKQTMENVRNFLQRLLKVIPNTKPIDVQNFGGDTNYRLPYRVTNTDLYMGIMVRTYGVNGIVAEAGSNVHDDIYSRPLAGIVLINARKIPASAQDENSNDNEFFYVCIHEIFHALGIEGGQFYNYHPYESTTRHNQITCSFTKYGRYFNFLVTPYAHNFAVKQFGVETFQGDDGSCPSGIEIEDACGGGTAGSHLEGRVYMTELMTGQTIQTESGSFNRLTDASMAILQDTGNYKVDWRMGQPLVWGHPESIDGNPIKDFALGPPQRVFPELYIWNGNQRDTLPYTGFDFKFWGPAKHVGPPSCPGHSYCDAKSFYNPNNYITISDSAVFDYMKFIYPNNVCPRGEAAIPSTYYGLQCSTYQCNGYESFTYDVKKERGYYRLTCDKSNVGQRLNAAIDRYHPRTIWCPDPERFCRTMKLYEMHFRNDPFLNYTKQLVDVPPPATPTPTPQTPTPNTPTPQTPTPKTPTPHTPTPKTPTPNLPTQKTQIESSVSTVTEEPDPTIKSEIESGSPEKGNPAVEEEDTKSSDKGGDNNASSGKIFGGLSKKNWIIIGAAAGGALLLIIIIVSVIAVKKHKASQSDSDDEILHTDFLV